MRKTVLSVLNAIRGWRKHQDDTDCPKWAAELIRLAKAAHVRYEDFLEDEELVRVERAAQDWDVDHGYIVDDEEYALAA